MPALAHVQPDAGRIQEQLRVPELPRKPAAPQRGGDYLFEVRRY